MAPLTQPILELNQRDIRGVRRALKLQRERPQLFLSAHLPPQQVSVAPLRTVRH